MFLSEKAEWLISQVNIFKNQETALSIEAILYAISNVVWYNGLDNLIKKWKTLEHTNGYISVPDDVWNYKDLQVIWMICVSLFGDYGTSPRGGWITDIEGFYNFIDAITSDNKNEWEEM